MTAEEAQMARDGIRIAIGQFKELTEEKLAFAAQIGASGVQLNAPNLPGEARWEEADLRRLVETARAHGLRLEAIENVPVHFYDKAMLGLPGRDQQIDDYRETIRNLGRAGVPILGFHFMPNSVWRTERAAPGRGGAGCTRFDMAVVEGTRSEAELRAFMPTTLGRQAAMPVITDPGRVIDHERMWANYTYFIRAVLPVAEEAGVKLALHPDDPPVPMLGGVARIFATPEGFKRAWALNPESPAWGLDLCLGCCSEMVGGAANVREMIEFFGPKGRIHYVHFRDVQGTVPCFQECFLGEGNYDPAEVMLLLMRSGFDGFVLDDHVPRMDGDSEWAHRGRAHAIGYLQGLIRMAERTGAARTGADPTLGGDRPRLAA
jgi:mannonate dehydratase